VTIFYYVRCDIVTKSGLFSPRKADAFQPPVLPRHDECCGFGGTFAVKNAEVSTAMGLEKVRSIQETGAAVCAAGDNSCLMQIGGLLHRQGAAVRCMHLAEILAATAPGEPAR